MSNARMHLLHALCAVVLTCGVAMGQPAQTATVYNVKEFGAATDGKAKCTEAVTKAIAAAVKAGGGTVYFPAGEYLTGPIHLESKITLDLDAGSVLKFSTDFDDYLPMVKSRWEGLECINFSPQIYAYQAEDIAIVGRGVIEGQGKIWWDTMRLAGRGGQANLAKYTEMFAERNKDAMGFAYFKGRGFFLRPPMIQLVDCRRVRIEGVRLQNPPFWTCNPVYCEDVVITGLSIKNPGTSPNTDGINPDSCRNVHISDCHISVGDDCITIKSGRDEDGRRVGKPCENITVTNCTMLDGHGGVVIGSEMSGGVKKVTITNCVFDGTQRGIRLKTSRNRGGVIEDITVSNIVMNKVQAGPIHLDMFYERIPAGPVSERTPAIRNLYFSNIIVRGAQSGGYIVGLEEMPVENVSFSDIYIDADTGFSCKDVKGIVFRNVRIDTKKGQALVCENVERLELAGLTTATPHEDTAVVDLLNSRGAYVHDCWAAPSTGTFLRLRGDKSAAVIVQGNQLGQAKSAVVMEEGFPEVEAKQQ